MSVKILIREIPPQVAAPGVYTEIKDPLQPTAPIEHPIPWVQIYAQPRHVHTPPPDRYAPPSTTPPPPTTPPLVITTASPIATAIGPVSIQLAATGGTPPLVWSAPSMPASLTLSTDGLISGQLVERPAIYNQSGVLNLYQTIPLDLIGVNGVPPYTFSAVSLPTGVSLSGNTLSAPTVALGSYPITLGITDSLGQNLENAYSLHVLGGYPNVILADNPIAYWRFGELTGTVALDIAGNAYNGTYVDCLLGQSPLITSDYSVKGNGTTSYVDVGAVAPLYSLTSSFSFECWFRPASISSGALGIWSSGIYGFALRQNGSGIEILSDYSVSIGVIPCNFVVGGTYHIVAVIDAAQLLTLYVNDVVMGTLSITSVSGGNYVLIGADSAYGPPVANSFDGMLDEMAIYGYALTAAQISVHYTSGGG